MWELPAGHILTRTFAGLTEHAFLTRLGIADPALVDYISGLLGRFVHTDTINRLRDADGRAVLALGQMISEADALPDGGRTKREYFRHIGDVALFWTGLFPEAITRDRRTWGEYAVMNYTVCGKRSYLLASQYEADEAPVLRRLSRSRGTGGVG